MNRDVEKQIVEAAHRLDAGEVVGYPSETVWGLAASPRCVQALYELKGRDQTKPVQVSFGDPLTALSWTQVTPPISALSSCWPGPLTLVVKANRVCPPLLAPGGWVGLRVPAHPVAQALLQQCGGILATTSLNPSGKPAAVTREEAAQYALTQTLLPEGPEPAAGVASTVVRMPGQPDAPVEVLRLGAISLEELRRVLRGLSEIVVVEES